jgi:selenocysteine-specific elongation factor
VRRFVIGTAGHVDHGKTTLVAALTGIDTDRLPEEKRRGITIELGFAPWALDADLSVSIIDVPGHRRLVHTMIAGATGIELVLLVVAADEGVMPQTREHVAACELLGLRRAVVAITKVDRSGEELAELAAEEALALLGERWKAEAVLVSARSGQGLEALRDAVKRALREIDAQGNERGATARLSVDRAFSVKGAGSVVTGTLVGGRVALGSPLRLVGEAGAVETVARGLHVHDHVVDAAEAPTRLAVNIAGVALDQVHRGDVLTSDASVSATKLLDVAFFPVAAEAKSRAKKLKRGAVVSLYVGTARATAKARPIVAKEEELAVPTGSTPATEAASPKKSEEESAAMFVRLRLAHPLVVFGGDRYVLRGADVEGPAGAVLGGGVVLDARAPRARPREKRLRALRALDAGDAREAALALVSEASPKPFAPLGLSSRLRIAEAPLLRAIDKLVVDGTIVRLKNGALALRSRLLEMAGTARMLVAEHHKAAPLDRGLPLETLRRQLAQSSSAEAAEEAIRLAARKGAVPGDPITVEGDIARLPGMENAAAGAAGGALGKALRAMEETGLRGLSEAMMREATGASPKEVKAILAKLTREGVAMAAGELWFARKAVDGLKARISEHIQKTQRLTIADLKTISGLGRRQVIPLLEAFDRDGFTKRDGDDRVAGPAFAK